MLNGITLRKWQEEGYHIFEKALQNGEDQIYTVAAVGSGKTMFASVCASIAYRRGQFNKIIIVAPQYRVKVQWANTFQKFGIHINPKWNGGPLKAYQGVSLTYDGVVSALPDLIKLVDENTLVILDEIHHTSTETGDEVNAWGKACAAAFSHAGFRIVLSGTPWRYTKEKILFTPYIEDDDGRFWVAPDISYSYGEAIRDKVNRPTKFKFFGGEVTIQKGGNIFTLPFEELYTEQMQRQALRAALDLSGEWVKEILKEFYTDLMNVPRRNGVVPAGLVVCKDQTDARNIQNLIFRLFGLDCPIVLSDLRKEGIDPQEILSSFETSRERILISVGMVAEGVDIPRLTHCLYLSNVLSSVFIWQVLGRIVRTMKPRLVEEATMYLPQLPMLIDIVSDIESDVLGVAERSEDPKEKEEKEEEEEIKEGTIRISDVIALSSSGEHSFTIYRGVMYSPDEMNVLQDLYRSGINELKAEEFKRLLQSKKQETSFIPVSFMPETMIDQEEQIRAKIKKDVARLSLSTGIPFRTIHKEANQAIAQFYGLESLSTSEMTIEQLKKKMELIEKKLYQLTA